MTELKPCWCCGAEAKIYTTYDFVGDSSKMEGKGWIECLNEDCLGGWLETSDCDSAEAAEQELISTWNRRHDVERIVADLRRASEDLTRDKDMGKRYAGVLLLSLASLYERGELLTEEPKCH
jgi:hypothetical protein